MIIYSTVATPTIQVHNCAIIVYFLKLRVTKFHVFLFRVIFLLKKKNTMYSNECRVLFNEHILKYDNKFVF